MSSFYGLEVAQKSLYASQKAIEVTAHNISNVNTEGYTRQTILFEAATYNSGVMTDNKNARNVGSGVTIQEVRQIRDDYYDKLYRKEIGVSSELASKSQAYTYLEQIVDSQGDKNISNELTNIFNSIERLALDSENLVLREDIKQNAILLTDNLNSTVRRLYDYQSEINSNIKVLANSINDDTNTIAQLNKKIFEFEITGNKANDLRDQRNLVVDELASKIGITTAEGEDGTYKVMVNGFSLVDHTTTHQIQLKNDITNPVTNDQYASLYWDSTNTKVNITSGELKGLLDIRDGNSDDNPGINYLTNKLDTLAGSLVSQFNAVNSAGYTLPYGATVSQTGINFFDPTKIHAIDIEISSDLKNTATNIAASSQLISGYDNWSNNENLQNLLTIRDSETLTYGSVDVGNFEDYIENTYTKLSFATGFSAAKVQSQESVVSFVINQKDSISGVNLDEELLNLTMYQKSYQASAKLMSVIDEMMQTLINIV